MSKWLTLAILGSIIIDFMMFLGTVYFVRKSHLIRRDQQ